MGPAKTESLSQHDDHIFPCRIVARVELVLDNLRADARRRVLLFHVVQAAAKPETMRDQRNSFSDVRSRRHLRLRLLVLDCALKNSQATRANLMKEEKQRSDE